MDDEGVSCTVCHSITEAGLNGTGSYTVYPTVRMPFDAFVELFNNVAVGGNVSKGK